jgi:hypothetical protein
MNVRRSENSGLIHYLETTNERPGIPDARLPDQKESREFRVYGTHPEIAERVWAQLGASLPVESRQIVLGRPALLSVASGIVFAIALGTSYAIQIPRRVKSLRAGLPVEIKWSDGPPLDVQKAFGPDWIVGDWSEHEPEWCVAAHRHFDETAG